MARKTGTKNRNYPPLTLDKALRVPRTIQDEASGMKVSRLTLAELLDVTPTSSTMRELVASARFYGLTEGGTHAEEFSLTELGEQASGGDEVTATAALKAAVMNVPPYKAFFDAFAGKKMPSGTPLREFLIRDAKVPEDKAEECAEYIASDAATAGLRREMKGSTYIDLEGVPVPVEVLDEDDPQVTSDPEIETGAGEGAAIPDAPKPLIPEAPKKPKKVFIAHGKNRTPLDQLKKALDQFKVKYAVALDEAHQGRPISAKVAQLMSEECSSGIFIFTADEQFTKEVDGKAEEVWRPSENVVFELGAASILYENRIVIFKEKGVSFPSDFSDLGYIEFEKDQLVAEIGSLFQELVSLDILEVRAKG
jgi:Predicted nucleotide-binding protein containing TIR-like domain